MGKRTVKELFNHLATYKDAVILFGNKAINKYANDTDIEMLTNKKLRREPKEFWDYYNRMILSDPSELNDAQLAIKSFIDRGFSNQLINLTTDGRLYYHYFLNNNVNMINLHGIGTQYKCTKCKTLYPQSYIDSINGHTCERCGKSLRPNILLEGENYFDDDFNLMKEWILNTHTLFCVGVDWGEDPIANLIIDYAEMKDTRNQTEQDQRMVVLVGDDEIIIDFDDLGNFEYVVHGDVNASMKRLLNKEGEL